jgi:DMSO/TMAO reductase YedYZ heme-binding membrane subunit
MSTRRNLIVLDAAILIVGLPSLLVLWQSDFDEESFGVVLRATARVALLVFLVIFVTRPLHQLATSGFTRTLQANRRNMGIAFAGVMTAHLGLLIWFNGPVAPIPGIIAYSLLYLMLVTSFDKPRAALGLRRWKYLHKTGLYVLGYAFAQTIVVALMESPGDPVYLALAALFVIAILLRAGAFLKKRSAKRP